MRKVFDLKVIPFKPKTDSKERYYLIIFENMCGIRRDNKQAPPKVKQAAHKARGHRKRPTISNFNRTWKRVRKANEHSLRGMRRLQEDLSTANENSQSANEELQSTNEELETAKEELQSSNEELDDRQR